MVTNSPVFVSNDDNIFFTSTDINSIVIHLSEHTEKAKELITSNRGSYGRPEHPYFKISLSIRLFQEREYFWFQNLVGL